MPIGKWQCFLDLPPPPPPPSPRPIHHCIYGTVLNYRTRKHSVRRSGGSALTYSARGFSEARVRPCWRLSRSKHLHVIIHKCLILIFKRYGVNKHNLLTTSYFFDESGCDIAGSTGYQRKSRVLKLLLFLWSIISTVVILILK